MTFCTHCETYLPPEAAACPACGAAAPEAASPALAWQAALPASPGSTPVAFAGGALVSSDSLEHAAVLACYALANGQTHWQHTVDHALISGLVVAGGVALVSLTSTDLLRGQGALVALDANGADVWRWSPGVQQVSAPAVFLGPANTAGALYLTADATTLVALDLAGNEQGRWSLSVSASRAAPAVTGDTIVVPCRGPHLLAFSPDGVPRWRFDAPLPTTAWLDKTPLIVEDTVVAVSSTGVVFALNSVNGAVRWQANIGPAGKSLSTPFTDNTHIFIGARDGLYALDFDGNITWHFSTERRITAAPVVTGDVVYTACHDHRLYALDAASGKELWRYEVERRIEVAPLILSPDKPCSESPSPGTGTPSLFGRAIIADRGGTVTVLTRPLSAAEHEVTGQWVEAACAYVALGQSARGAALLEAHDEPYKAAQLWRVAGEPERAAEQYEVSGRWKQAVEMWLGLKHYAQAAELLENHNEPRKAAGLWEQAGELERAAEQYEAAKQWPQAAALWDKLGDVLRQAEALQYQARVLEEADTPLEHLAQQWATIADLYQSAGKDALTQHCRREEARCRQLPDIALRIEHEELVLGKWTMVNFIVGNEGFGPARSLVIRARGDQFDGEVMRTQRIISLDAGAQTHEFLDVKPLAYGDHVPLRITVEYADHTDKVHTHKHTLRLPVAQNEPAHRAKTHTQVMRARSQFVDMEIRIFACAEQGYPVEIRLGDQQEFERGFLATDCASTWIDAGEHLLDMLLTDPQIRNAWARARGQAPQRRIRLRVDPAAPELHALPWEALCEADVLLSAGGDTPFSRYLPSSESWGDAVMGRPIRVLVVLSDPTDLDAYDLTSLGIDRERANLAQAFAQLDAQTVTVDFLPAPVTLARLEKALQAQRYHVLHFVGHGSVGTRRSKKAGLYLQDKDSATNIVSGQAFARMLARQNVRPDLVFLAACESAKSATGDAFRGIAQQVVQAGVPAVVAMQGSVSMATARQFSAECYRGLLRHGIVDLAVNQARSVLLTEECPDALLPVLFMRLRDGKLWERQP